MKIYKKTHETQKLKIIVYFVLQLHNKKILKIRKCGNLVRVNVECNFKHIKKVDHVITIGQ